MFNSPQSYGVRKPFATTYHDVGASTAIEGASPHKLVSLLYGALVSEINCARGAVSRGDVAEKCRAIGKSIRIVDEGLRAPLDMQAGGAIAQNLRDVYDYLLARLTLANARSDAQMLAECAKLAETLRDGWDGIADQVPAAPKRIAA